MTRWALFCVSILSMAFIAASHDDYATRSKAPSTRGHWTASDAEDEEEVMEVADVATFLPNENVKQIDVCESGVVEYDTKLAQEHKAIVKKSSQQHCES